MADGGHLRRAVRSGRARTRPADEGGYVTVLFAIASMALLGIAALVLDVGVWYRTGAHLQQAADAAALAGIETFVESLERTGDQTEADRAGRLVADEVLRLNRVDPAEASIAFVQRDGAWVADVGVTHDEQPIFAGLLGRGSTAVARDAQATYGGCAADCGPAVLLRPPLTAGIQAGVGGDGWQPVAIGGSFFNMFHHDDGSMFCVDATTRARCTSAYPAIPYPGMRTNYTPKLTPVDHRIFFVTQQPTQAGLGCWDGRSHQRCAGFASPFPIAAYQPNGSNNASVRFDGPVAVGNRLFMLGDDLSIRCVDVGGPVPATCAGYPAASPFSGRVAFALGGRSVAEGVRADYGVQFDMLLDGTHRLYLLLNGAVGNGTTATWLACWDPTNGSACAGFGVQRTSVGRKFLFALRDATGRQVGVCARAGNGGGNDGAGPGHQCFLANGTDIGSIPGMFTFNGAGVRSGQQEVETVERTIFPYRGSNSARCWDWTAAAANRPWGAPCDGFDGNGWSGRRTEDYAYWTDGGPCAYGLGHRGELWSFSIESGRTPCDTVGAGAVLFPCACDDGAPTWTTLDLVDSDLSDYGRLRVTIRLSDGTVLYDEDLVALGTGSVDLGSLIPDGTSSVEISVEAESSTGNPVDLFVGQQPGVAMTGARTPVLIG